MQTGDASRRAPSPPRRIEPGRRSCYQYIRYTMARTASLTAGRPDRADHPEDGMAQRLGREGCKRCIGRDVKVGTHDAVALDVLFQDGGALVGTQFGDLHALGVAASRQSDLPGGAGIADPVYRAKGSRRPERRYGERRGARRAEPGHRARPGRSAQHRRGPEQPGIAGHECWRLCTGGSAQRRGPEPVRALGDSGHVAERLWALGIVKTSERDYARAAEALEESLALRRERGDAQGAAVSQATLGVVALNVGDLARARALLEEALETHRGRNDRWGQALVQAMLGHVEVESGAVGRARELFGESAAGLQAIGNVLYLPWCLEGLVGVAAASGHAVRAARLCGAHEVLRERIGSAMLPLYPAGYERACATARAALSDADFAAAVAAGRSSPVEIVIAAALEPAGETAP